MIWTRLLGPGKFGGQTLGTNRTGFLSIQSENMRMEVSPCCVGDAGQTCHLETHATPIELAAIQVGKTLITEGVHKTNVVLAMCLGFVGCCEFDFGPCRFEKAANAWHPAILETVEISLRVREDRCRGARFELHPSNVHSDLLTELSLVECVGAGD
jgi:hypothetical protein